MIVDSLLIFKHITVRSVFVYLFDTQAVMERDEEIKRTREEALRTQRNLEEQLAEERGSAHDNQVITATTITR